MKETKETNERMKGRQDKPDDSENKLHIWDREVCFIDSADHRIQELIEERAQMVSDGDVSGIEGINEKIAKLEKAKELSFSNIGALEGVTPEQFRDFQLEYIDHNLKSLRYFKEEIYASDVLENRIRELVAKYAPDFNKWDALFGTVEEKGENKKFDQNVWNDLTSAILQKLEEDASLSFPEKQSTRKFLSDCISGLTQSRMKNEFYQKAYNHHIKQAEMAKQKALADYNRRVGGNSKFSNHLQS